MGLPTRYLKSNAVAEPLVAGWYCWQYLLAPASAAMMVTHAHLKMMESFAANPALHEAALRNPALRGGPFINLPASRADEVRRLAEQTGRDQAPLLAFARAWGELDELLMREGTGMALEPLYARVPEALRGYVELVYDVNHQASARLLEGLLYRSPLYRPEAQRLALWEVEGDARPYIFNTPRLHAVGVRREQEPLAPQFHQVGQLGAHIQVAVLAQEWHARQAPPGELQRVELPQLHHPLESHGPQHQPQRGVHQGAAGGAGNHHRVRAVPQGEQRLDHQMVGVPVRDDHVVQPVRQVGQREPRTVGRKPVAQDRVGEDGDLARLQQDAGVTEVADAHARLIVARGRTGPLPGKEALEPREILRRHRAVSYTHLTLPTKA